MRLRRQLLLVSLLTLALPWAGCEYIQEMEKTLRQGQQAALTATAQAVAARLASDGELLQLINRASPSSQPNPSTQKNPSSSPRATTTGTVGVEPIYAHRLDARPVVDGYDDDWRNLGLHPQTYQAHTSEHEPLTLNLLAGRYGDELFLFCQISDQTPVYYAPTRPPQESDNLTLWLKPPRQPATPFTVRTGAPGQVAIVGADGEREHRLNGIWQEWQNGYQLELRLPLNWALDQFGIVINDAQASSNRQLTTFFPERSAPAGFTSEDFATGVLVAEQSPPPVVTRDPALDNALSVFVGNDTSVLLRLATPQFWLIAEAGKTRRSTEPFADGQEPEFSGNAFLTRLYRLALAQQQFPSLPNPRPAGRYTPQELQEALAGNSSARWYRANGKQTVRVAVPVIASGTVTAVVIAEQTTDTLQAMTDSAFNRLVSYSLIAFAIAGLGLLTYASWLSWRIQRLSRAAEQAVDSNGRISRAFPHSRRRDELGDLARRYSDLLERLRQYNSYLETLASKLSHELRTPLAVVRSSLDNLDHESLSHQATVYRDRAKDGAERLSGILTAMSSASRVEQSIRSAELEQVDTVQLLRDLTAAYADAYPQVDWAFTSRCDRCLTRAAPELLVQMLDKLADNAADFCPPNQTVQIALDRHADRLVIQISNPGPPLPASMQGQLFESLVSIRDSQTVGQHLGLGLYIVRLIAEFHHGSVAAYNLPNDAGAVFEVSLPIQRIATDKP